MAVSLEEHIALHRIPPRIEYDDYEEMYYCGSCNVYLPPPKKEGEPDEPRTPA